MKKAYFSVTLWLLAMLCVVSGVKAAEQDYYAEVAVSEQSQSQYGKAVRLGLQLVISKLSQGPRVLNREDIQLALNESEQYVEQFQYRTLTDIEDILDIPQTNEVKETGSAPYVLALQFSIDDVNELLAEDLVKSTGKTVVEGSTLFWVAIEANNRSDIVGADIKEDIQQRLTDLARASGLNAVFPLLDLQDYQSLGIGDIRGGFADRIRNASQRYETDSVVTGLLTQSKAGYWISNWTRYSDDDSRSFSSSAQNIDSVLIAGTEWVAETGRVFVANDASLSDSSLSIWIGKVDSVDRYTQVTQLLESLPGIVSVAPSYLSVDGMVFTVSPRQSLNQLQYNLSAIPWLRQSPPPETSQTGPSIFSNADLFYDYSG